MKIAKSHGVQWIPEPRRNDLQVVCVMSPCRRADPMPIQNERYDSNFRPGYCANCGHGALAPIMLSRSVSALLILDPYLTSFRYPRPALLDSTAGLEVSWLICALDIAHGHATDYSSAFYQCSSHHGILSCTNTETATTYAIIPSLLDNH